MTRRRVYEILDSTPPGDVTSRVVGYFLIGLIALNVLSLVLESVDEIYLRAPWLFQAIEWGTVACFTVEYLARLWSCTADPRYGHPVLGRIRFALTPLLLLDLLAIMPFYVLLIPGINLSHLQMLRTARAFRLLRLFKLGRYSVAMQTFGRVFWRKREQLLAGLVFMLLLLLFSSTMMYFAEREAQPAKFASIPAAMWWSVVTLTTVGYGDVFPMTAAGRAIAAIVAVLGIGMFALPTSILGAGFVEEFEKRNHKPLVCPHCGQPIEPAEQHA